MENKFDYIFIGGMQKSGTTLLMALLDAHTGLLVFPAETRFFPMLKKFMTMNHTPEEVCDFVMNESGLATLNSASDKFKTETNFRKKDYLGGINGDEFRKELSERLYSKTFPLSVRDLLGVVTTSYAVILGKNIESLVPIEKTPGNEFCLDDIKSFSRRSGFLHIIRNPFDNAASYIAYQKTQGVAHNYSYFLASLRSLAVYVQNQNDQSYKFVRYEDMVSDTETQMRDISNWLGVDFEESMLHPTLSDGVPWKGNSSVNTDFDSVSAARVNASGKRLSKEDITIFEALYGVRGTGFRKFLVALNCAPVSMQNKLKTVAYYFYARLFLRRPMQIMRELYFTK